MKQLLQIASVILMYLFLSTSSINAQITRGAVEDEIYISISSYWDFSNFHMVILHSTDNGENLSLQYENIDNSPEGEMQIRKIIGDATPGVIYNYSFGNGLWVSFDYGVNWIFKDNSSLYARYWGGETEGVIYRADSGLLYKSNDYAQSYEVVASPPYGQISDVGFTDGEFFGIYGFAGEGYYIHHSIDYDNTYTEIPIDSSVAFYSVSGLSPKICRGAESGEIYLLSWWPNYHYKIFHSVDTGYTWTEMYESDDIDTYFGGLGFIAGRKEGSFYVIRGRIDPFCNYTLLYIDYSEDYGETFTTYFHRLDEYFPEGSYHNDILSFNFNDFEPPVIGEIDEENHKVFFTVSYGTDFTSLVPTITVSQYASVEPASGIVNDFSIPVT
ncbi:MAG: hypothetical protein GXO79_09690, partial [Chlorobi bacterium]|nr:hypothetical protein [Chlorobiota bacterium]